jgi:hypothetical protein
MVGKKFVLGFLILTFAMLMQASAVQYYAYDYKVPTDNVTTRLFSSVTYTTYEQPTTPEYRTQDVLDFFITPGNIIPSYFLYGVTSELFDQSIDSGKPLEFYIQYSAFVDDWNRKSPSNRINYCNFTVFYIKSGETTQTAVYNDILTTTTVNAQYFVRLSKGDSAAVYMDCLFAQNRTLDMPADYTIVFPTWECKACQYYNWNKDFVRLEKAKTLGTYNVELWKYIKGLFQINFQLILIAFWIIVILVAILSIGLVFTGAYWLYLYIEKHTR